VHEFAALEKNNNQKQRQRFHGVDANRSVMACQCTDFPTRELSEFVVARWDSCEEICFPSGAMD